MIRPMSTFQRALIAVYDKTGIADVARVLAADFGMEILSTGGTARHLAEAGVPVTMVETVTRFPELLDGRVKTLHPHIHAGILADRDRPEHVEQLTKHGIQPIDMVIVNLYPFDKTVESPDCQFEEAIEMIDIGGPCMLRAAAKNHRHVVVIPTRNMMHQVLDEMRRDRMVSATTRLLLASLTFTLTSGYDAAIAHYLADELPPDVRIDGAEWEENPWFAEGVGGISIYMDRHDLTRYGENPDQKATVWRVIDDPQESSLLAAPAVSDEPTENPLIHGQMSFNNYVDGDAALSLMKELARAYPDTYAAAFIKHTNACGCAIGDDPVDVYRRAYLGDPVAAAGGVLCMNFPVTREIAETVMQTFVNWGRSAGAAFFKLDVWIAPRFEDDAYAYIITPTEKRKWGASCRLLAVGDLTLPPDEGDVDFRKIVGGMLVQSRDLLGLNEDRWKVVTRREPTDAEWNDLRFAWLVCKHTKSNAISICRDRMLLGSGAGQMSRVKSCDLAIQLARENGHGDLLSGAVAAGDAFFPVPDGPGKLIEAGISAMIHPGGSNRDKDSIAVCDEADVAMVMTDTRHFKH